MSTSGTGSSRLVRRIGKNRRVHEADMAGEFAGFLDEENYIGILTVKM